MSRSVRGKGVVAVIHPLEGRRRRIIYDPATMKYGRPVTPRSYIFHIV